MERSLVLIKPDGVQRGLIGRIIQRFEDAGFKIVGLKMVYIDKDHAGKHYADVANRRGKRVFKQNVDFLTTGPVIAMVLEGIDAVDSIRKMVGSTEPKAAAPGTIRGDFSHQSYKWANPKNQVIKNLVHASSDAKEAKAEIDLWFEKSELHSYKTVHEIHTFGS